MELRGKVALVTGASSGIGQAVAERLAAAGARVIAHGRDEARTQDVARRTGGTALLGDFAIPGVVEELAVAAHQPHGAIDVIVTSAGFGWFGSFDSMDSTEIDRMVAVNLLAPLKLVRAVLPGMLGRGAGHIVLISSIAGRTGVAGEAVYAATKGALDVFADSLRLELAGSGIGVTVILPAAVETDFFLRRGRPYDRRLPRQLPADRVAAATVAAIRCGQDEVWVPRWLRAASVVRAVVPRLFRALSLRFGEQVSSDRDGGIEP